MAKRHGFCLIILASAVGVSQHSAVAHNIAICVCSYTVSANTYLASCEPSNPFSLYETPEVSLQEKLPLLLVPLWSDPMDMLKA